MASSAPAVRRVCPWELHVTIGSPARACLTSVLTVSQAVKTDRTSLSPPHRRPINTIWQPISSPQGSFGLYPKNNKCAVSPIQFPEPDSAPLSPPHSVIFPTWNLIVHCGQECFIVSGSNDPVTLSYHSPVSSQSHEFPRNPWFISPGQFRNRSFTIVLVVAPGPLPGLFS